MKRSIKHLPKETQEELTTLLELIRHYIPKCQMVILFGSYARGNYVVWDEHIEQGVLTSYQSDYDIMIVVADSSVLHIEGRLRDKIDTKYEATFTHRRHAPVDYIVEDINKLNKALERSQYFFTDIVKEGIMLYNSKEFKLAKPRKLSFKEIKEFAVEEYENVFPAANVFLDIGNYTYINDKYINGSFQLHQACERYYHTISLVFTNYRPKSHKLNKLGARVKKFSRDLSKVFPLNTDFEKHCFDLICRAYIDARYSKNFVVTKEELKYMIERAEILKEITERICKDKIISYDAIIEQDNNAE